MFRTFMSFALTISLGLGIVGCSNLDAPTPENTSSRIEGNQERFSALQVVEFMRLFSSGEFMMIDVRTPEEIAEGKIAAEALEIDYYADDFRARLDRLDKSKKYLVYCRSGRRSGLTMEIMKELGFSEAYDLSGGILTFYETPR